ncbi:MAG TPA: FAD-binding oxidoreductase [Bacteroidales bacterium]|nr:FAD-binding oxidoreductase [Bacteroidales bacterium]
MDEHKVKILDIEKLTHNVKRFRFEKPAGYSFNPGQATEVSINLPELSEEKRPFTFTSLPDDPYLEFTIKIYPERHGVTHALDILMPGHELIIRDVWGAITYRQKGVFIAGGAGVTPFISILRDLYRKNEIEGNRLIFANKTSADIILEQELRGMLGDDFINILSKEKSNRYYYGRINEAFIREHTQGYPGNFYVCGPQPMVDTMLSFLEDLGYSRNSVTIEV